MESLVTESGKAVVATTTFQFTDVPCRLVGFYVASTSAGTIVWLDGTSSGTAISGTITPAVGFHPFPAAVTKLSCSIANTLNITAFYTT